MTPVTPSARARTVATTAADALHGRSTLLVGPAGSGRTVALQQAAAAVALGGGTVRRFVATTGSARLPLGLFLGVLDAEEARRLATTDAVGRAGLVRAAVLDLRMQVVVVDEASLLDAASAALLLELAEGGTAVIAGTATGRPLPDAVRALFAGDGRTTVALPPLDATEVAAVVAAELAGPADSGLVAALAAASAGSPSVLIELIRDGRAAGAVARSGDLWCLVRELPAPASLQRRLAGRFAAARPAQQAWLAVVALAGVVADDLADGLADDETADWAERAGWTVHAGTSARTSLRTPSVRTALLSLLGARTRIAAARRLLIALESLDRPLTRRERLAHATCRLETGVAVEPAEARRLAVELGLPVDGPAERLLRDVAAREGTAEALVDLAARLVFAGRGEEAETLLREVDDHDRADRLRAGVRGFTAGEPEAALAAMSAPTDDEGAALEAGLLRFAGRTLDSLRAARAVRAADGPAAAEAIVHEALALIDLGDAEGALAAVADLRVDPRAAEVPGGRGLADWLAGRVRVELLLDADERPSAAAHEVARSDPHPGARAPFAHLLGRVHLLRGDPRAAVQVLREAAAAPGLWVRSRRPVLLADLATALALCGEVRAAQERLDAIDRVPPSQAPRVDLARAAVARAARRGDDARVLAARAADAAAGTGRRLDLVDALHDGVRYGDRAAARRLLEVEPVEGPARALQRRHAEALLAEDLDRLQRVAADLRTAGLIVWSAEAAAEALRLREVAGEADRAAVARLGEWLAAAPGLVLPLDQARRPSTLTAREAEVARLAAGGLPDRLVAERLGISVRTAQTHLARAFGKLGVHRRAELPPVLESHRP